MRIWIRIGVFQLIFLCSCAEKQQPPSKLVSQEMMEKEEKPPHRKRPKLCLNMIVKNENHVIKRCLDSILLVIDYWVIVDTGSTDGS